MKPARLLTVLLCFFPLAAFAQTDGDEAASAPAETSATTSAADGEAAEAVEAPPIFSERFQERVDERGVREAQTDRPVTRVTVVQGADGEEIVVLPEKAVRPRPQIEQSDIERRLRDAGVVPDNWYLDGEFRGMRYQLLPEAQRPLFADDVEEEEQRPVLFRLNF